MASQVYGGNPMGLGDFASTERYYVDPALYMAKANDYPFVTYLLQRGVRYVGDWEFKHHTKDYIPIYTQVNKSAGHLSTDTTLTVDDATVFRTNDLIICFRTLEIFRVCAIASATTITVGRSIGSTAAAALVDNDYLLRVSPAARHGEAVGEFATLQAAAVTNYVQEFTKTVRTNRENTGVQLIGGNRREQEQAEKIRELWIDCDRQIIIGEGGSHTSGAGGSTAASTLGTQASTGHPLFHSHGVMHKASSYVYDNHSSGVRATITEANMNAYLLGYVFPEAIGQTLPLFCSTNIIKAFNYYGRAKLEYGPSDVIQGIKCNKYQGDGGVIELIHEPQLSDVASGYGWNGCAFSIHPDQVFLCTVAGNELRLEEDVVKDGTRQFVDEWINALGLVVINEKYVSWIKGVSGGA